VKEVKNAATKGNLLKVKKMLAISNLGYELLDRKRNILIREMLGLIEETKTIGNKINETYATAYDALQHANISLGVITRIAGGIPVDSSVNVSYKSVMGVEIPKVSIDCTKPEIHYGFYMTNHELDLAYVHFNEVKQLTTVMAEIENGIFRLAVAIKKTQKRANALKNILIPRFTEEVRSITNALEEKEREEFSRLKVIKAGKLLAKEV
jgi:V/A-type H+-transporting ATPase subunit D